MVIHLRLEKAADHRAVEELTREAFWINTDCRPYIDEHYLVHKLRDSSAFIPELDYVAEVNGRLVGNIMYSRSKIVSPEGVEHEVLSFGPLSVLPEFQGRGIGKALMRESFERARGLGFGAIVIFVHPDYHPRLGFRRASDFGITAADGTTFPAIMALELVPGSLDGITGRLYFDAVYEDLPEDEVMAFDARFPSKKPRSKVPIDLLLERLKGEAKESVKGLKLTYLGDFHRIAVEQVANLRGIDAEALATIRSTLQEHGRLWGNA